MVDGNQPFQSGSTETLRVLYLAAEADPLVKIGGLGDVAGSLPRALRRLSDPWKVKVDIRLALPLHGVIQHQALDVYSESIYQLPYLDGSTRAEALSTEIDGLPVYLISGPLIRPEAPVYSRDAAEDSLKYTFFSLAALELSRQLDWQPHILHANDWHTAPAIYALHQLRGHEPHYQPTASVLGVHNLPYLGEDAEPALTAFGFHITHDSTLPKWAQRLPLALGLMTADKVVAVSPTYAEEILTPEYGSGLSEYLQKSANRVIGILNGLDYKRWDPATDPAITHHYDINRLSMRSANKAALQEEFGLPVKADSPLMAVVSRMDPQKGIDLIPPAIRGLARNPPAGTADWQAILLGSGIPELETAIYRLEEDFPNQVRTAIRFDDTLSRRLYSGADLILIPSRYEPSGLTQMIAMRYGCIPVARATGGLRDTIQDFGQRKDSTGFLFKKATSQALAASLRRALRIYHTNPDAWEALQRRGMQRDFSWEHSARQYLDLYLQLAKQRQILVR